jgi:tetratricopeptide (TPR) repeat protein
MQSEKPSFARFGGSTNFSAPTGTPVQATPASQQSVSQGAKPSKAAAMFDALVTISLTALFFGLPLFFTGLTLQGAAFDKQIYFYFWVLVGIVSWVSKGVISGEMKIRKTPLDIPIALFTLFYIVTTFFSVDRWHSFWGFFGDPSRGLVSVIALALAYYLVMSHFNARRFVWMAGSFLVSGFVVVVWSLLVIMKVRFLPQAFEQYAPMSLIGNITSLSVFLAALVPLFITAIFFLWKDDQFGKNLKMTLTTLAFLGLAADLFILLALYAFVPWVVVLGGLALFLVYILAQIVRPVEQWTWVPMLVFVLVLAFLMIGQNSLVRAQLPVEVTPNVTLSWHIAKESLKEHFLTGVGPAQYGYAFSMFRPQEYNMNALYTMRFYQGTGILFEALATIGAVGTVLLLVLWLSFLSVTLYLLTHEKQRNKIISLGLSSASLALLIAAFVTVINGPLLLIGTLLASLSLAVLLWESGSEERYLQLSFKAAPKFALALAFIFMVVSAGVAFLFVFVGKVFVADAYAGKAVRMAAEQPSQETAKLLVKAAQTYPQEGRYYTRLGQEYMALANAEFAKKESDRDLANVEFYVREAVAASEFGRKVMPNDVMAAESLALVYENSSLYAKDALPKAAELYGRSRELEPHNPIYLVKLAQTKKAAADAIKDETPERTALYTEAKDLFEQAVSEKGNLAPAYYGLAIVYSSLKNTDKAIENATQAAGLAKDNLNYRFNLGALYQLRDGEGDAAKAEGLFKDILEKNPKLIDVRLSLGILYEKQNKKDAAIKQYEEILALFPADAEGGVKDTRDQVEKLIANVKSGVGNLKKAAETVAPLVGEQTPAGPSAETTPAPVAPADPNASPLVP